MKREIGENAKAWKGLSAGYVAKHMWIVKHYGKATHCVLCNNPAKRFEWANISGKYLREISDYRMLCPSCHRKADHGDHCRKGHRYTKTNTRVTKEGWRVCRKCFTESQIRYRLKRNKNATSNKIQGMGR